MKLSEAMREGAKIRPQGTHAFFAHDHDAGQLCSCALGAAIEAASGTIYDIASAPGCEESAALLSGTFPHYEDSLPHPISGEPTIIFDIVIDLNDSHGWPREKIADFLAANGH